VDAFTCYKQKCKVVSLNLAHPVGVSSADGTVVTLCKAQDLQKRAWPNRPNGRQRFQDTDLTAVYASKWCSSWHWGVSRRGHLPTC